MAEKSRKRYHLTKLEKKIFWSLKTQISPQVWSETSCGAYTEERLIIQSLRADKFCWNSSDFELSVVKIPVCDFNLNRTSSSISLNDQSISILNYQCLHYLNSTVASLKPENVLFSLLDEKVLTADVCLSISGFISDI